MGEQLEEQPPLAPAARRAARASSARVIAFASGSSLVLVAAAVDPHAGRRVGAQRAVLDRRREHRLERREVLHDARRGEPVLFEVARRSGARPAARSPRAASRGRTGSRSRSSARRYSARLVSEKPARRAPGVAVEPLARVVLERLPRGRRALARVCARPFASRASASVRKYSYAGCRDATTRPRSDCRACRCRGSAS